jgi:nucleotide-binding universal stress UspA family protein
VNTAIAYGSVFNAHIIGIHMIPYPIIPVYGGIYPDTTSYSAAFQMENAEKHAEEIKNDFIQSAKASTLTYEWKVIEGLDLDFIIANARYTDMVIVPAVYSHFGDQASHHLCNYFATNLGIPLLIIPNENKTYNIPKKVVIAWNESHESARAVHDAIPILKHAEKIQIISVSKNIKCEKEAKIRGEKLQTHLNKHNLNAELIAPKKLSKGVGFTIKEHANEFNADLIVMGAYGQSRLKEVFLGGTTKYLIEHSTLPLFTSN